MTIEIPKYNASDSFFENFWLSCPNRITRGSNRDIYEIPGHKDKVLKVSNRQANLGNWSEIIVYTYSDNKEYLANIFSWSRSGKFLIMERLQPVTFNELKGHNFPVYLNDKKPENYGRDNSGNIKVLDYGLLDFSQCPLKPFP